jgi:hypothetical protein
MKIIILTKFTDGKPPVSLYLCKNRFQVYACTLYNYLLTKENMEVSFDQLPLKGKTIINNHSLVNYKITRGDHAIIIDDRGFKSRSSRFKEKLKECIRGSVTSIGVSTVYYGNEDNYFYMDCCSPVRQNCTYINWLNDDINFIPNKDVGIIRILIQKPENNLHNKLNNYHDVIKKIKKFIDVNQDNVNIDVGILGNRFYENLLTEEIIIFDNCQEKYNIMRQTDIYIITSDAFDRELLYEFGLSNTLIVTNKNLIDGQIIDDYDTVYYNKTIPWSQIIESLNNVKSRERIINKQKSIDVIYQYFESYTDFKDVDKIIEENKINNSKYYKARKAYIEAKQKLNKIEPIDPNDKKPVERERGRRLVQSRLRLSS